MNNMVETNKEIHQVLTHNELRDKSLTRNTFFKNILTLKFLFLLVNFFHRRL